MRPPTGPEADAIIRRLQAGGYLTDMAADQQRCVSRSVGEEALERETQTRRSGACGKRLLLEDTQREGIALAARGPCKRKNCTDCGPVENAKRLRHFLALMDGHQMRRRRLERAARRAALAKLRRAGHQWVPIPAPDGTLTLWATGGVGELVAAADLEPRLAADLAAAPAGRPITPSRGWSRQPVASRGNGRLRLLGHVRAPMPKLVEAAQDAKLYKREVPLAALPAEWAEAHELVRPLDDLEWRRFTRRIGLYWPEPRQQRRKRVAA